MPDAASTSLLLLGLPAPPQFPPAAPPASQVTEAFADLAQTTVASGGATAPVPGTVETWTVTSSAPFPPIVTGVQQFHVRDPSLTGELMLVTAVQGTTWTVTRGADGTVPQSHAAGFTVIQVVTAKVLASFSQLAKAGVFTSAVSMTPVSLTDASLIVVNAALGNQFRVPLTSAIGASRTLGNPANGADGQIITFWFIQPATGGPCSVTLGGGFHFGTDLTSVTLSALGGATDRMTCQYDANNQRWDVTGFLRGW